MNNVDIFHLMVVKTSTKKTHFIFGTIGTTRAIVGNSMIIILSIGSVFPKCVNVKREYN